MVNAVGYTPNTTNTTWQQRGDWQQGGRGTHAERQGYTAMSATTGRTMFMFVQDGAPCETCHPHFITESSNGVSFIFIITRAGYAIQAGTNINMQSVTEFNRDAPRFVVSTRALELDASELPCPIYFYNGSAYLQSKPHAFPAHPSIVGYG